ncbi:unnamed protein product, partial [Laminaria digitata]
MQQEDGSVSSACAICGGRDGAGDPSCSSTATDAGTLSPSSPSSSPPSFALRCNSCRLWYHPWCLGYQLDLDRSCLITAAEVDIDIDATTGLPLVCQWFCDSCASTVTGVVAATGKGKRPRPRSGVGTGRSNGNSSKGGK